MILLGRIAVEPIKLTLPKALKMLHVADRHLDDLCLFDSASTLLQIFCRYESTEISQTIVHAISSTLLNDPM